jgi:hypothetical protein
MLTSSIVDFDHSQIADELRAVEALRLLELILVAHGLDPDPRQSRELSVASHRGDGSVEPCPRVVELPGSRGHLRIHLGRPARSPARRRGTSGSSAVEEVVNAVEDLAPEQIDRRIGEQNHH